MAWPVLSKRPLEEQEVPIDNAIKHETEDGHVIRRPRYSRIRSEYLLVYDWMPKAEADLLWAHFVEVRTYLEFPWIDHLGISHQVMFKEPVKRTPRANKAFYLFGTITLTEV